MMRAATMLVIGAVAGGLILWDILSRKVKFARVDDIPATEWGFGTPGILNEADAVEALAAYASQIQKMSRTKNSERKYSVYWDVANIHLWSKKLYGGDVTFSDKRLDEFLKKLGRSDGKHYFVSDRNKGGRRHQNLEKHGWTIHYQKRDTTLAGALSERGGLLGAFGRILTGSLGAKPYTANVDDALIDVMKRNAGGSDVIILLSGDHGYVEALSQLRPETVKVVISGKEALSRALKASSDQYLNANLFLMRARKSVKGGI